MSSSDSIFDDILKRTPERNLRELASRNKRHQLTTHEWLLERLVLWVVLVLWTGFLWVFGIVKIALEGFQGYVEHLTNWCWTVQAVFWAAALVAHAVDVARRNAGYWQDRAARFWVYTFLFYAAWTVAWCVFWLAFVMVYDSPSEITKLTKQYGGAYSLGFVLFMDRVLHVLPAVLNLIFVVLERRALSHQHAYLFQHPRMRGAHIERIVTWSVLTVLPPVGVLAIYVGLFDPRRIYHLDFPLWALGLIGGAIIILTNAVTAALLSQCRYEKEVDDPRLGF